VIGKGFIIEAYGHQFLVISGGSWNGLPDEPDVVAVSVLQLSETPALTVNLGDGLVAFPGRVHSIPKIAATTVSDDAVNTQTVSNVHNILFKVLSTN
jgi:hypothetical protein